MILIKSPQEIELMKKGGQILARILKLVQKRVRAGISTGDLDKYAETLILKVGGRSSFKGYQSFPTTLCTSINHQLVHTPAVPGQVLKNSDILSLDIGMQYPSNNGMYTDMAVTLPVGKISLEAKKLIKVTKRALELGMKIIKPGKKTGDLGAVIQKYVEQQGFSVIRDLVGHGVGKKVHEEPRLPNYGKKDTGVEFEVGMTLALEPMVSVGHWAVKTGQDKQTIEMADRSLSAHFEHTVVVTKKGCQVLTSS